MRNPERSLVVAAIWFSTALAAAAAEKGESRPGRPTQLDKQALERKFAENLSGSVLEGIYTKVGDDAKDPNPDRYEIDKVSKVSSDVWLFHARYGDQALPPLPLRVLWAGDTPVITMDDFTIPVLGTFSFRVLIDGDLYVGTWQHGNVRGHMSGTIEKATQPDSGAPRQE